MLPCFLASVKADPKLYQMRFKLVPSKYAPLTCYRIKEEPFWRNWTYRIHLITQAFDVEVVFNSPPAPKAAGKDQAPTPAAPAEASPEDEWEAELKAEYGGGELEVGNLVLDTSLLSGLHLPRPLRCGV